MADMSLNTVYPFRTSAYARAIYIYGTNRFTVRDGYNGIPAEYYVPVQQYVATNFTVEPYATEDNRTKQLDITLSNDWINQTEYNETVGYIV